MPNIPGHYFARPAEYRRYGQAFLILFLIKLSNFWHALEPSHPFGLGDIAMHDGSTMKDHVSHDGGTGVDIYIIARNREQRPAHKITYASTENCETQPCYDFDRTLKLTNLISTILLTGYKLNNGGSGGFLYNDPEVQRRSLIANQIRSFSNHDDHIHLLLAGHPYTNLVLTKLIGGDFTDDLSQAFQILLNALRMLRFDSRGDEVVPLQMVLSNRPESALAPLAEDGIFGPKTKAKVVENQIRKSLSPDGIVGPKTKNALATERLA